MKSIKLNLLFYLIIIGTFTCYLIGCSQSKSGAALSDEKKVPIIELSGTGYERGLQHGKQLKNEIAEVLEKWKANIVVVTKRDADSVITDLLTTTNFEPAIKRWTPDLIDEVKGIADGSEQKYNDIFAFQLVDEFWVYLDRLESIKNAHCSGIGIFRTKNHPTYISQNLDEENYMSEYQTLLHIKETSTEPEQYILTCAGIIALNGMNEKGIGVCVNALLELQASQDGLPVAFVIRGILGEKNGEDAFSFLKTIKHASGQNYIVGIQDSVYDYEVSANQIIRFYPEGSNGEVIYHTNHALVNHDVKPWYLDYHRQVLAGETNNMGSEIRFNALKQRLDITNEEISLNVIKSTLRSKDNEKYPVCITYKEGGRGFSFSSTIFTLTDRPSIQVTFGSPDQSEYQEYFFLK